MGRAPGTIGRIMRPIRFAAFKIALTGVAFAAALAAGSPARAQLYPLSVPFTRAPDIVWNTAPLLFGMDAAQAATALGVPLAYVAGRPGEEVFVAARPGGSGYFPRNDRLYLQFRKGRLTGWKGDWGKRWMW